MSADPWVTEALREGYHMVFKETPPMSNTPIHFPSYEIGSEKGKVLDKEVLSMTLKGAIEIASSTPGFYSRLFVVPKASGSWRPIIDLSALNEYVYTPSFKMETPKSIIQALQKGQWMTSLDMKDAYFHIPIHPLFRRYLRFCHHGKVWQFKALPFGLSTSPRIFTKILMPVLAYAHVHGVKLHMYLDDWLINPDSKEQCLKDTKFMLDLCEKLGIVINHEKSDLIPSQSLVYLGILIDTKKGTARPSDKRLEKWRILVEGVLAISAPRAYQWLSVLGHLVSLEKLVPYGRLRIRPLQWQLRQHWSQATQSLQHQIPWDLESRLALQWWVDPTNITRGVPLGTVEIDHYLFTDSSTRGWGAHMEQHVASGKWTQSQRLSHINLLELRAVWLGLLAFKDILSQSNVAIMCDNTSTIAYLKNQGGTRSQLMCDLALQVGLWAEKQGITMIPKHIPGHLNVLADSLSRENQVVKTEWSLSQSVADKLFHCWGRPHVDLFALSKNTKLPTFMSPIPETDSWKVDSLVQSWSNLYAYAYPPTSLIRASLNKIVRDKAELILIAPLWPNQEWFPDLLSLAIDNPVALPPTRTLLKQTFFHHFHQNPRILNLHAWRLSQDLTLREGFLRRCPRDSIFHRESLRAISMSLSGKCSLNGVNLKSLIRPKLLFQ